MFLQLTTMDATELSIPTLFCEVQE